MESLYKHDKGRYEMKVIYWLGNGIGLTLVLIIAVFGFLGLIVKMAFYELIYLWIVILFAHVIYEIWRW